MLNAAEQRQERQEFCRGIRKAADLIGRTKTFSESERNWAKSVVAGLMAYADVVEKTNTADLGIEPRIGLLNG